MTKDKTQPFLFGGPGKDVIIGSPGQDVISGGLGVDVALLGGGLDTFTWAAGDGGDIVEGGAGTDFLRMDGTVGRGHVRGLADRRPHPRAASTPRSSTSGDLERLDLLPGRRRRHACASTT